MDEVWFVVVDVGVMFSVVVLIFLLMIVIPLYGVLEMFGSILLSFLLHRLVLLLFDGIKG